MLEVLNKNKSLQKSKEHLSLIFYDFKKKRETNFKTFKIRFPISPKSIAYPNLVLDVNFKKQFNLITKIYKNLYSKKKIFLTKEIINFLKKNEKNLFKKN